MIKKSSIPDVYELKTFQSADSSRFNRFILEAEASGDFARYEKQIEAMIADNPKLKSKLPESIVKKFDSQYSRTIAHCTVYFLRNLF